MNLYNCIFLQNYEIRRFHKNKKICMPLANLIHKIKSLI